MQIDRAGPIAERLRDRGYRTAAFVANQVLDFANFRRGHDDVTVLRRAARADVRMHNGFVARTFETYGAALNRAVFAWLHGSPRRPLYIYAHYMDTHYPYNATGFPVSRRVNRLGWYAVECAHQAGAGAVVINSDHEAVPLDEALRLYEEMYDSGAAAFDRALGALLEGLRARGMLDDALLVVTADHGEEFLDNEEVPRRTMCHNGPLTRPQTHVPLLVREFGARTLEPATVREVCSNRSVINAVVAAAAAPDDAAGDPVMEALRYGRAPRFVVTSAIECSGDKVSPIEPQRENELAARIDLGDGAYYKLVRDDLEGAYRECVLQRGRVVERKVAGSTRALARRNLDGRKNSGAFDPATANARTIQNLKAVGYLQ